MYTLLTHGSSNAKHAQQAQLLAAQVSALLEKPVAVSFLSDKALAKDAIVLPLFLSNGKHMQQDVPALTQASNATMLPPLLEAVDELAALVIAELTQTTKRVHVVAVVYQFTGFEKIVSALYKQGKGCSLFAISSLHGAPSVPRVLQSLQKQGIKKVVLQPILLLDGHSLDMCKTQAAQVDIEVEIKPALIDIKGFAALVANIFEQGDYEKVG